MIIHSTTLDTEAKVKAQYGGTAWMRHGDYVLRGASSGVTPHSATKTGGNDTHTITELELPSHTHTIPPLSGTAASAGDHVHKLQASAGGTGAAYWQPKLEYGLNVNQMQTESAGAHTHTVTTTASTTGSAGNGCKPAAGVRCRISYPGTSPRSAALSPLPRSLFRRQP